MITEIHIGNVASYKGASKLLPKNKISLIYGLNGAGKSTISNYLYSPDLEEYKNCKIKKSGECDVLVYNQSFLSDYFYEEDSLKGIFTLSKENKSILQSIHQETKRLEGLEGDKIGIDEKLSDVVNRLTKRKESATKSVWEIKTHYSGGDRVLEYCLDGLKRSEKLFTHISSILMPATKPEDTIEKLKYELSSIKGDNAVRINRLNNYNFSGSDVERDDLFKKIIVGSQEGSVAEFINNLGNVDWVKAGLEYVPNEISENAIECPFCQEKTITKQLLSSIKNVFDLSYENDIEALIKLQRSYQKSSGELIFGNIDDFIVVTPEISKKWRLATEEIKSIHRENTLLIEKKLKSPSAPIELKRSDDAVSKINDAAIKLNSLIDSHNRKLENKSNSLNEIKNRFWNLMRWDYDQTLSSYETESAELKNEENSILTEQSEKAKEIEKINQSISALRKKQ